MAKDVILLGEVAARGATMRDIIKALIGACPNREETQWYTRCDPYCPTLLQLFGGARPR